MCLHTLDLIAQVTSHLSWHWSLIIYLYSKVSILIFTVHLWSTKCQNSLPHKYQTSSGKTSSLLMKTSCLRLKLVELNFFACFMTDDQSNFNVFKVFIIIKLKYLVIMAWYVFSNYRYLTVDTRCALWLVKMSNIEISRINKRLREFTITELV